MTCMPPTPRRLPLACLPPSDMDELVVALHGGRRRP
jgi:hypothetical protein